MALRAILALAAAAAIAAAVPCRAEAPSAPAPQALPRASASISVDGNLEDPGWSGALVLDHFYETSPGDNLPAKVNTTAYLTYDDQYFYVGIKADDPEPSKIRAPYVERDQVIGTDDNLAIFLDTRNDKRSALELRVNPRGIQADGIYDDANGTEHVDRAARHPLDARLTAGEGRLEQAREIFRGLSERAPRLHRGRAIAIEQRRAGPHSTHPCEHPPHALYVRDDGRDGAATAARRRRTPEGRWQDLHEILRRQAALTECLEELALHLQWPPLRHVASDAHIP